ncbi:hypothetical protein B0G77_8505 [Paraburkholderia sp. BL10I2N1]|nr:hypothetical protein B0G77_8505 [Paraburkholderia sp. BL10I2N1]
MGLLARLSVSLAKLLHLPLQLADLLLQSPRRGLNSRRLRPVGSVEDRFIRSPALNG